MHFELASPRASLCAPSPSRTFFKRYHAPPFLRGHASSPQATSSQHPSTATASSATPALHLPELSTLPALRHAEQDLEDLLERIQASSCCVPQAHTTVLNGTGMQLGMPVTWELSLRWDGAFKESVTTPFMSFSSGFDGSRNGAAWDVDSSGVCHRLQLDDHEAAVLAVWGRAGAWTLPALRQVLHIEQGDHRQRSEYHAMSFESFEATSSFSGLDFDDLEVLRVRLKSGKVWLAVAIDRRTWRQHSMALHLSNDKERWALVDWNAWGALSTPSPTRFLHEAVDGCQQHLAVHAIDSQPTRDLVGELVASSAAFDEHQRRFAAPHQPLLPQDAAFLPAVSSAVPVWTTGSGHLLAKPVINGCDSCGYFIVDTGASGFVIDPATADELGMSAFGELHITGMAGKVKGQFRRAETFTLGPLQLQNPVMMEMPCNGVVYGFTGKVLGIIGYDVFRRAVVDIPPVPPPRTPTTSEVMTSPAAAMASNMTLPARYRSNRPKPPTAPEPHYYIHLYHPETAEAELEGVQEEDWLPVTMLSSLPHLEVKLFPKGGDPSGGGGPEPLASLLMVDTGAGGMGAMLNHSAGTQLGLVRAGGDGNKRGKMSSIRGVGGNAAASVTLESVTLPGLTVGGASFDGVSCLVAGRGAAGGVELSHYSAGILCGDILTKCRLVVDLPRQRLALVPRAKVELESEE